MIEDVNQMEYEANVFVAEFMLSDDAVLESLEMQMDFSKPRNIYMSHPSCWTLSFGSCRVKVQK